MKRSIVLFIIPVILVFAACSKKLDQRPISSGITEEFYDTKQDFQQASNAAYSIALRGIASNSYGYPDRQLNLSETRSDNLYAITDGTRPWEGINSFFSSIATNEYVEEAYTTNYAAIGKINTFLEKIAVNGSVIGDSATIRQMIGEVRFLRAFCYFDLVRWFGKVPIVDKTMTPQSILTIPRSPVADVYNFIIADLDYARNNLPPSYTAAADKGRATSYAAKTLLALTYMTRSGVVYPQTEGPGLGTDDWAQALSLLNEVLAGPYAFINDYKSIFSYTNENNSEVVFDVQYQSGGTGVGGSFVWVLTPDGYFQSFKLAAQGANYQRPVSNDFLSKFPVTDLRRQFSIQDGYTYNNQTFTYSFYKKMVDVSKYGNSRTDWPLNFIVWRITDVMLLKAECILHGAPGSQADVDAIVNKVRARAGYTVPVANVTLADLMEERRKEFCGEGSRWHDLVRSGLVTSVMPAWIAKEDIQGRILPFKPEYVIYPIPLRDINVKPGLYTQNKGYE